MNDTQFGPGNTTLVHEAGHNLGLWHTHHGVSEVTPCTDCYELAGSEDDNTGDRCSDTDPTPVNWWCSPPGGIDQCNGVEWGTTDFHNYMGYAGPGCWSEFSLQQVGRMLCWTEEVLFGWLTAQCEFTHDVYFGTDNPPTILICDDLEAPPCDPGPLDLNTTYYWQVVAGFESIAGVTDGPVWSFSTASDGPDCNQNGILDSADIAGGTSQDCNGNDVPDECDVPGDADGDDQVGLADLSALSDCMTGPCSFPPCDPALYADPCCRIPDFNADGAVNLADFAVYQREFSGS
jgi:hypothetical protein